MRAGGFSGPRVLGGEMGGGVSGDRSLLLLLGHLGTSYNRRPSSRPPFIPAPSDNIPDHPCSVSKVIYVAFPANTTFLAGRVAVLSNIVTSIHQVHIVRIINRNRLGSRGYSSCSTEYDDYGSGWDSYCRGCNA